MRLLLALALVGCGKGESPEPPSTGSVRAGSGTDKVTGSLSIDGKPVTITGCRVGHTVHTFVEVVTEHSGRLHFEDGELRLLYGDEGTTGADLACTRLDRSWGGGTRTDGTSYWRGKLDITCGPPPVVGSLEIECGNLTTAERLQLESNRQDVLAKQRSDRSIALGPFVSAIPDGWIDVTTSGDPSLGALAKPGARVLIAERPASPATRSIITVESVTAPASWKSCEELRVPGIDLIRPTEEKPIAGDRVCTFAFEKAAGRIAVRVHGTDAIAVELARGSDHDPDADRAFDAVVAKLDVK